MVRLYDWGTCLSKRPHPIVERIFPLPGREKGPLHHYFSELFDWIDSPHFKNFLRLDVSRNELRFCCFAGTGCPKHEDNPSVEDEVRIKL